MIRVGLAALAGAAWMVSLPLTADALQRSTVTGTGVAFVVAAFASASLWWMHLRERRGRIGVAGAMAGWLFIGSMALLGVSGFLWVLVAIGLLASTLAYATVLLVTHARAASPRLDLATGVTLFATAGATTLFAVTTGLPRTDAWWMPAHWILAIGIGIATFASGLPSGEVAGTAPESAAGR